MIRVRFMVAAFFAVGSIAFAQSPPASRPALNGICHGEVRFTVPAGWKEDQRDPNDVAIRLIPTEPPQGYVPQMIVQATPTDPEKLKDPEAVAELGRKMVTQAKARAADQKIEFVKEPALLPDKRFLFKINEQYKQGNGVRDQFYAARRVGTWVVTIIVRSDTADEQLLADGHKTAERFLDSMIPGVRQKPDATGKVPATLPNEIGLKPKKATLAAARLSIPVPDGWKEELHDGKDGIVAVMRDALDGSHMLVVSVRTLPPEAAKDAKLRDTIIDELAKGERVNFKLEGGQQAGPPVTIRDARFIRKTISEVKSKDVTLKLDSRQRLMGERLISVSSVSLDADYQKIADLADRVSVGIE